MEHCAGATPGFASRYRTQRLAYVESFSDVRLAIAREKRVKSWRREKKIALIEMTNPTWKDLAERWLPKVEAPIPEPHED